MELVKIYKEILEQLGMEEPSAQPAGASVVNFPSVNMNVSLFPSQKKLVFSPEDHESHTNKIRTYVNMLKNNFKIYDINDLKQGSFEVVFDPRENFEAVVDFINQVAANE